MLCWTMWGRRRPSGGEELDSAAWKGAASRACGARGGCQDTLGGAAAPPNPAAPQMFWDLSILGFCAFQNPPGTLEYVFSGRG